MAVIEIRLVAFKGATGLMGSASRLAKLSSAKNFPHTAKAVEALTKESRSAMLKAVQGKYVHWSGGTFKVNRITGALHGAILGGVRYPYGGNPLRGALVVEHPHYKFIRDGVKPYDMKPGILAGKLGKTSKAGVRYAVVPIKVDPNKRYGPVVWRVLTQYSKGWVHPGTLPRRLDLYTQEKMRDRARQVLKEAMLKDLGGKT
jgi:hypothetical protein